MMITQERSRSQSFYSISTADAAQNQSPRGAKLYSSSASGLHKSQRLSVIAASYLQGALILPRTPQYSRAFRCSVDLHAQAGAEGSAAAIRAPRSTSPVYCSLL